MLVYEDDANVLPRLRVLLKGLLDLARLGLVVDDEEVPLSGGHMLGRVGISGGGQRIVKAPFLFRVGLGEMGRKRTPMPARRRPVTESCDVLGGLRRWAAGGAGA